MNDKTVAFVLYPGLTPLDLIGPLQVMSGLETVEETFGVQPRHHVVVVTGDVPAGGRHPDGFEGRSSVRA